MDSEREGGPRGSGWDEMPWNGDGDIERGERASELANRPSSASSQPCSPLFDALIRPTFRANALLGRERILDEPAPLFRPPRHRSRAFFCRTLGDPSESRQDLPHWGRLKRLSRGRSYRFCDSLHCFNGDARHGRSLPR